MPVSESSHLPESSVAEEVRVTVNIKSLRLQEVRGCCEKCFSIRGKGVLQKARFLCPPTKHYVLIFLSLLPLSNPPYCTSTSYAQHENRVGWCLHQHWMNDLVIQTFPAHLFISAHGLTYVNCCPSQSAANVSLSPQNCKADVYRGRTGGSVGGEGAQ